MKKLNQLYEGKSKKLFATDDPRVLLVSYKDDATAFNGLKCGRISGKGAINNLMTNHLMKLLEQNGIPTHYIEGISGRETLVKRCEMIPLEVVVRNIVAGSLSERLHMPEGTVLRRTVLEYNYKSDELGDPMVNETHIAAFGWASPEALKQVSDYALKANKILRPTLEKAGLLLVDFKLEFGILDGKIILADEISPDTCRFWDIRTRERLDKDRFRRDMDGVREAYIEAFERIVGEPLTTSML